jgi:heavy metal sensor kinase
MRQISIRARLTLWYAVVLFVGMLLLAWVISATLERRLISDIDAQLAQRIEGLKVLTTIEGETTSRLATELHEFVQEVPNGSLLEVKDAKGNALLQGSGVPRLPPEAWNASNFATVWWRGQPIRVLSRRYHDRDSDYSAAVAAPLTEVNAVMRELRDLLGAAIPGVLLVAVLGGYWISRKALSPVDEITKVARSISAQNLSRRLPVLQTRDELQRMSEAWNDVLARLESALNRIRNFTADASHELRTPVALIRTTAELALRRNRDETAYRKALSDIQGHAERMSELTESLLTLARADAVGAGFPMAETSLSSVIQTSVKQMAPIAEERRISLHTSLPPGVPVAKVNATAIQRLLLILIDNALKYTPSGGHVAVSLTKMDGNYRLSVADSGMGIDENALPHIFERFYRADPARSSNGTGLGLPIAQMIAEAHGTSIKAENNRDSGSTFHLLLQST